MFYMRRLVRRCILGLARLDIQPLMTFRYSSIFLHGIDCSSTAVKCDNNPPSLPRFRKTFCRQNTEMCSSRRACGNVFRWCSSCATTALLVVGTFAFSATAGTTTARAYGPRNTLGAFDPVKPDPVDNAVAAAVDAAVDAVDRINPKLSQVCVFVRGGGGACALRVCVRLCMFFRECRGSLNG